MSLWQFINKFRLKNGMFWRIFQDLGVLLTFWWVFSKSLEVYCCGEVMYDSFRLAMTRLNSLFWKLGWDVLCRLHLINCTHCWCSIFWIGSLKSDVHFRDFGILDYQKSDIYLPLQKPSSQVSSCFISIIFFVMKYWQRTTKLVKNVLEVSIICSFLCQQFIFVDYYPE